MLCFVAPQAEIVDETDTYMDNDKTKRVDLAQLMESLPPTMLATLRAEMLQAAQNFIKQASLAPLPSLAANHPRQLTSTQIRAVAAATAGLAAPAAVGSNADVAAGSSAAGGIGGFRSNRPNGLLGVELQPAAEPGPAVAAPTAAMPFQLGGVAADGAVRRLSGTSQQTSSLGGGGSAAAAGAAAAVAVGGDGWSRMRVSSSPATLSPADAVTGPANHPASSVLLSPQNDAVAAALSGVQGKSCRASAPGVLSQPQGVVKPVAKVFKSARSPMLAPSAAEAAAALPSGLPLEALAEMQQLPAAGVAEQQQLEDRA